MKKFENLYHQVITLSRRPGAAYSLALLSFLESFILPFPPPDVMLAPMSLAAPAKAMRFATLTLTASVVGGIVGYLIGVFAFEFASPYILAWGYQPLFEQVTIWFDKWGFWAVLMAGFSPVPYKIFTISAGVLGLALIPFILASLIGRGARFYMVAYLLSKYGSAIEQNLLKNIEKIGWVTVILLILAIIYFSIL